MKNHSKRTILIVLDSVGIGGAKDAFQYGDDGSNTLGNIVRSADEGKCDIPSVRTGSLQIPNLESLGVYQALTLASGQNHIGSRLTGAWGVGVGYSRGKDTTTGHWEIAACPIQPEFHCFTRTDPIPSVLLSEIIEASGIVGVIGILFGSGTELIEQYGAEHIKTGKPIIYTSADSVIQIAADEYSFGLDRLYNVCRIARKIADRLVVGRVIARPFVQHNGTFKRTNNRRDFTMLPPAETILDKLKNDSRSVIAVGKINDIFTCQGITKSLKASGIDRTVDVTLQAMSDLPDGGLIFSNIVEFDSEFGHRRDVAGYANALEEFDKRLPEIISQLVPGDLLIITADHGNDPTFRGTDHTRECIPILIAGSEVKAGSFGLRKFADIGATIAEYLGVSGTGAGSSFLMEVLRK